MKTVATDNPSTFIRWTSQRRIIPLGHDNTSRYKSGHSFRCKKDNSSKQTIHWLSGTFVLNLWRQTERLTAYLQVPVLTPDYLYNLSRYSLSNCSLSVIKIWDEWPMYEICYWKWTHFNSVRKSPLLGRTNISSATQSKKHFRVEMNKFFYLAGSPLLSWFSACDSNFTWFCAHVQASRGRQKSFA